ncbi:MAG: aminotransferase class I/II-fold pyridoxal phosphate-dependent enzyme, partial [Akkermansiaceae bacterium]|nr:aminotransferase class I/II-fold pyridoxal phosphate-dependent enzyme [Akkermansiaceae bacterium]
ALREAGLLRHLRRVVPGPPPLVRVEDRELVNFSSNDYLGLSHHPVVVEAARDATNRLGAGASASRLICGSLPVHVDLEERL